MKFLYNLFFSTRTMAVLLTFFFVAIAAATFIENDFGTITARKLVFNAVWFEVLMFMGMVNLAGVMVIHKLYRKGAVFVFHLSFMIILLGAAITRYFGYEGIMAIREGSASDSIVTGENYITIQVDENGQTARKVKPVLFGSKGRNRYSENILSDNTAFHVQLKEFIPNAVPSITPSTEGKPMAEVVFQGWNPLIIALGEQKEVAGFRVAFQSDMEGCDLYLVDDGEKLWFRASYEVNMTAMTGEITGVLPPDSLHPFQPMMIYSFRDQMAVLRKYYPSAVVMAQSSTNKEIKTEAVSFEVSAGGVVREIVLVKEPDKEAVARLTVNGATLALSYGNKKILLPFSIYLEEFILERYPGSNSPSGFESRVVVKGPEPEQSFTHRIYMNNVLKHMGYRFYQASYDADEKGTILSVNYDRAGTLVTYLGYLIMGLGMAISLWQRNSRFRFLLKDSKRLEGMRKQLIILMLMLSVGASSIYASEGELPVPDKKHAREFSYLLTQDHDGRIKPINTMSSELLRKISRKLTYKGLNSDQVYLGMLVHPEIWQFEPIIKIGHKGINNLIGKAGGMASFADFFSPSGSYILSIPVEEAYNKKPAFRSKLDNELIRVDERMNILYMSMSGALLNVFPSADPADNKWYAPGKPTIYAGYEDSLFAVNIFPLYLEAVKASLDSGIWEKPSEYIEAIILYQKRYGAALYPSAFKVKLEIMYNEAFIFDRLSKVYALAGFLMLIFQFIGIFFQKLKTRPLIRVALVVIFAAFLLHTVGLIARWYLAGHAPWSNGYEALIYIAWATVLAGIIFSFRTPVTLSATAVLAYLILHTAHLSWMDPEITSLVPVLKSYWLIIHVAVITASYGFFGLGALLAAINLLIMFFQGKINKVRIDLILQQLTNIIEMTLIIAIYLLTIGTFLGGIWANESWGRYWGWDPKETWALATIIVYAFVLHMRIVPGLRTLYGFNLAALLAFSSVIMTYFGVNYYLSGLHSYAAGDPLPVPAFVYYSLVTVAVVALLAWINNHKLNKINALDGPKGNSN